MSCTSQAALYAPPLPRYRFHRKTGTWRKEHVPLHVAVTNGVEGSAADTRDAALTAQASHAPFESSFDFFLRSVRPPAPKRTPAEREAQRREHTMVPLKDFEARVFRRPVSAVAVRSRKLAGDSHVEGGGSSAAALRGQLATQRGSAAAAVVHPLVGYACMTPLPTVYAALVAVQGGPLNFAAECPPEDRLSRAGFHEFLATVGPAETLSMAYQDTMFQTLPSYDVHTGTVEPLAVFTLLLDHRYHPRFNTNVAALFRAFDVDEKGVVAVEALHSSPISAWAAVRAFGNLRDQWNRFAAVVADETLNAHAVLPRLPDLVSPRAARAFLACTEALYAAACSLDLDGGHASRAQLHISA